MPSPSPRVELIANAVGALVAVVLFASSLAGLVALDGELEAAVSGERRAVPVPVSYGEHQRRGDGDCPEASHRDSKAVAPS
jgi:hypothetical protein